MANTQLAITGTAAASAINTARRLLESAKRRLLNQPSDTLAVSLVVPSNETASMITGKLDFIIIVIVIAGPMVKLRKWRSERH